MAHSSALVRIRSQELQLTAEKMRFKSGDFSPPISVSTIHRQTIWMVGTKAQEKRLSPFLIGLYNARSGCVWQLGV